MFSLRVRGKSAAHSANRDQTDYAASCFTSSEVEVWPVMRQHHRPPTRMGIKPVGMLFALAGL